MVHLLNELKAIPGVLGACLVNSVTGITTSNLPAVFKKDRLELIGKHLEKMQVAGAATFEGFSGVCLHFDESVVVAKKVVPESMLFVICDPSYNLNILALSLDLLQEEIAGVGRVVDQERNNYGHC